ncbi:hypothetical protein [Shewanella cyperi]|uniref:hypothetical protein n=1 Tax=Shewanella cyperi TaxID=2814292 RepID=UPI001A93AD82|nr:hypothetical protein [Shewanella cyperi]QSX40146.1 hypothetical protein JYB84_14375 [Shewanella cyperi]
MLKRHYLGLAITSGLLWGCGGSDKVETPTPVEPPAPTEYSHKISGSANVQGALVGALICADLNANQDCDADEPSATSDSDGHYQLEWQSEVADPEYSLIAQLPVVAAAKVPSPLRVAELPGVSAAQASGLAEDKIFARKGHGGELNVLTDLEFRRLYTLQQTGASTAELQQLEARLKVIIMSLYGTGEDAPYHLGAAESATEALIEIMAIGKHIEGLIAGQLSQVLAAEETLLALKPLALDLAAASGLSVQAWLDTDPLNLRYRVSDTLMNLGYITSPIDARLMSDADWDILKKTENEDDDESHLFSLYTHGDVSMAELRHGDVHQSLFVNLMGGKLMTEEWDAGKDDPMSCWNAKLSRWVGNSASGGYEAPQPTIVDNTLTRVYDWTFVPVTATVDKFSSSDPQWQTLIASLPKEYKLTELTWPDTIYRVNYRMEQEVMCRFDAASVYPMPAMNAESLTSMDLLSTLWPYVVDEGHFKLVSDDTFIIDEGVAETYQWHLTTSPSGEPLVHIDTIASSMPGMAEMDLGEDYLISGDKLMEVDIFKPFDTREINWLWLTYEESFSPVIYQHLKNL